MRNIVLVATISAVNMGRTFFFCQHDHGMKIEPKVRLDMK
jgi:hypothetical protein